jgi:hypothetical protein
MADTKWKKLLGNLLHLKTSLSGAALEYAVENLSFKEKTTLIKEDPVTCAMYYKYRFKALMNALRKHGNGILPQVKDYFARDEFQHRGAPHTHMLVWLHESPVYGVHDNQSVIS